MAGIQIKLKLQPYQQKRQGAYKTRRQKRYLGHEKLNASLETRRSRYDFRRPVLVSNLSTGGVRIETDNRYSVGAKFDIVLTIPIGTSDRLIIGRRATVLSSEGSDGKYLSSLKFENESSEELERVLACLGLQEEG